MAGGLVQLVAYGAQDLYLTNDPQITFFKMVYRRYTNFSMESIEQYFDKRANFGETVSCTLGRNGDLVHHSYLCVTLPSVPRFYNQTTNSFDDNVLFAWCKKIGYVLIKSITLEIGGKLIDKQYGEFFHIWDELTVGAPNRGLDKMIGNIPEMYEFSTTKPTYKLFIPLKFWFCRDNGLALPLIALSYNEVKINVEFRKAKECYLVAPTHSYEIIEDVCSFTKNDIISQNGATGVFMSSDPIAKTVSYLKINGSFTSATILKSSFKNPTTGVINNTLYSDTVNNADSIQNAPYHIYSDKLYCTPMSGKTETTLSYYNSSQFSFVQAFILADYIYLDNDERLRFARSKHEYLIEQLQLAVDQNVSNSNVSLSLALNHPVKELYWVCQLDYINKTPLNDTFNYTNGYKGTKSLLKKSTILLEGQPRFAEKNGDYFDTVQPYQNHTNSPAIGVNSYSFAIEPEKTQPSGTCNMSRIDNINLVLSLDTIVNSNNTVNIRVYGLCYNILRIAFGFVGVAFIN